MSAAGLDLPLSACRVCLKSSAQLQSIFAYTPRHRKRAQDLGAKLRQVSGLRCEPDDGLPGNICERCYIKLMQAYNFRTLCARSALALSLTLKGQADAVPLTTLSDKTNADSNGDTNSTRDSNSKQRGDAIQKDGKCVRRGIKRELEESEDDDFTWEETQSPFGESEKIKTEMIEKIEKSDFKSAKFHDDEVPAEADFQDRWECKSCGLLFRGGERLELHTAQAHSDGEGRGEGFHCYGCHEAFGDRNERGRHENKCMKPGIKFFCRLCSTALGTRRQFDAHLNTHRTTFQRNPQDHEGDPTNLACPDCPFVSAKIPRYLAHRLRHRGLRPFGCHACSYRTDTRGAIARHLLTHSNLRSAACPRCPYRARYTSSLRRHLACHTSWDRCSKCGLPFAGQQQLLDHYCAEHGAAKMVCCSRCGQCFTRKSLHRAHSQKCTKVRQNPADPLASDPRPFLCELCFRSFRKQSRLLSHRSICLERLSSAVETTEQVLAVQLKNEVHEIKSGAQRPLQLLAEGDAGELDSDGGPAAAEDNSGKLGTRRGKAKRPQPLQKCRLCECVFPRRSQLRDHVRSQHADQMNYACAWCGTRYLSASGHHSHLKICLKKPTEERERDREKKEKATPRRPRCPGQPLLHGPGPFICEVCGKLLKTYGSWRTHMDAHSGQRRTFSCPHCPFRSSSNGMAHSHRLRHAGLKPYACSTCPFRTDARQSLMMHARMHAGDLRHACRLCDFRAICVTNLKRHMASKHAQEKPFQCPQCDKSYFDKLNLSDHVACKHEGVKPHACHVCAVQMSSLKAKQRHYRKFHPQEPKPTRERPLSSH